MLRPRICLVLKNLRVDFTDRFSTADVHFTVNRELVGCQFYLVNFWQQQDDSFLMAV